MVTFKIMKPKKNICFKDNCKATFNKLKLNEHNIDRETLAIYSKQNLGLLSFVKMHPIGIIAMFFSSLIFNFGINFFIIRSQAIPTGLTAIPTVLVYIFSDFKPFFSFIYFAVNLPLLVFFFFKVKRSFIYLTATWMIFQIIWERIFNITEVSNFLMYHTEFVKGWNIKMEHNNWLVLFYTLIGAILSMIGIGISWKFGGSSGGTDIISYYYSTRKHKSIGTMMMLFSILIGIISFITIYIIGHFKQLENPIRQLFGLRTISTLIWIFTLSIGVNIIFPKYKKVLITIYTTQSVEIIQHLNSISYWHSFNTWEGVSGYTGRKVNKIETIILLLEINYLTREVKNIDPKCFITKRDISIVTGKIDTTKID